MNSNGVEFGSDKTKPDHIDLEFMANETMDFDSNQIKFLGSGRGERELGKCYLQAI